MSNILIHYASPYYDPEKAHEYYMKNRELKGRTRVRLNDEGKAAAKYVKNQLNTERKSRVNSNKDLTDQQINSLKQQTSSSIEQHKTLVQSQIDSIRARMKNLPKTDNSGRNPRERFMAQIQSLRAANQKERENLQAQLKSNSTLLRADHKQVVSDLKDEYDAKYEAELEKIRSDEQFQYKKRSKK